MAPHPGTRLIDTKLSPTSRSHHKPSKPGFLRRTLSEFITPERGKLRVIPASGEWDSGYTSQPLSPSSVKVVTPRLMSKIPMCLSGDCDPLALSERIGLLRRRCQSPENGYIRLSKTASMRRRRR